MDVMVRAINSREAYELITRGEVEVIDVRDPQECASGHVPGARLIPLGSLRENPAAALTRDGVIFVCAAGVRSQTAARIAAAQGLKKVYSLNGGVRDWKRNGYTLANDAVAKAG
jgi:rhodanese-related sulfurtransferase